MLADLESIQKRLEKSNKKNVDEDQVKILEVALDCIDNDKDISILKSQFESKQLHQSGLLSIKPKIFVCNVDEQSVQDGNQYTKEFVEKFGEENTLVVSADIENQINELDTEEKKNYMKMIGLNETGLDILIKKGYKILELETYFTSGPEETRAWTIEKNCTAPKAAGEIHTDFEKGFIRAETISYNDFVDNGGWLNSKTNGKMRLEGKEYIVKDGDVLNFRFNT
jgi:ribosome-binding ATPase YchF (GTP1/OBG family)